MVAWSFMVGRDGNNMVEGSYNVENYKSILIVF